MRREIAPHYAAWETAGVTPASLWRRAGEEGLLNCALPEPYGLGGDFGHAAVVIEELARANYLGIGFSIHSDMVAPYVDAFGTEAQKARWLPAMTRGELIGALALTEPGAGSDLKAIRSRAVRDGDHYVLNGQKTFITNGVNAGLAIVLASTAPDLGARGLSLFCVEAGLPGYAKGAPLDKIGQHSQDTCELFFDDLRLPADCLLGQENAAFEYLTRELARERWPSRCARPPRWKACWRKPLNTSVAARSSAAASSTTRIRASSWPTRARKASCCASSSTTAWRS